MDLDQYNDVETILFNTEVRQRLLNDLEELEFFLQHRLSELTGAD